MSGLKKTFRQWNHDFVDFMRDLRRVLIKAFFGRPFVDRGPIPEFKKIVVLRMDRKLGDSVVATGFFRALHAALPNADITVFASVEAEKLYRTLGFLNVIAVPKGMWPTVKAVWKVRKTVFDVLIETSHLSSPKSIFLIGQIKAKKKIAFKNQNSPLFSDYVDFHEDFDHVTTRYKRTLEKLGLKTNDLSYQIQIPKEIEQTVDRKLKEELNQQPYVLINSFAAARMRNLSEETTRTLVEKLSRQFPNHLVVSIGSPGSMKTLERWHADGKLSNWRVFPACTDFFENCRLIEKAAVVISVDTSIVHMACAFKRPLVGIYRGSPPELKEIPISWNPYGTQFEMVYSTHQPNEPEQDINRLNLDDVVAAAKKIALTN